MTNYLLKCGARRCQPSCADLPTGEFKRGNGSKKTESRMGNELYSNGGSASFIAEPG